MSPFSKYLSVFIFSLFTLPTFAADDAISTGFFNETAISGYDTVAYFTQGKPVEGDKKIQFTWRKANWYFSSQEHLALFKAEPEKYAPQYGGYCAWAMSGGKTASVDPTVWHIENNKLYLNYNKKVQKEWFSNLEADIVAADKYYPEITNVKEYTEN